MDSLKLTDFLRHDLVWFGDDPTPWVVCRQRGSQEKNSLSVGRTMIDGAGKKIRHEGEFDLAKVTRHRSALSVEEVLGAAPDQWRPALHRLASAMSVRVFGSLAQQALTGQPIVTDSSDIDVLVEIQCLKDLERAGEVLTQFAKELPLDGELRFGRGPAASWREWVKAPRSSQILTKEMFQVSLRSREEILAFLGGSDVRC